MSAQLWAGAPLAGMTLTVDVAFGADLSDLDGSGWTWTDVTEHVRQAPGISTALGRGDEASSSQPANMTLVLDNSDGEYSLGGQSTRYPYVRRGTPVRVRIDPGSADPAGAGNRVVFQGYADGWTPSWDALGMIPVVTLSASGILRRLLQGSAPLPSAYRRSIDLLSSVVAYWPMEEQRGARASLAARGGAPMVLTNPDGVGWGTSSAFESSNPLPDVGGSGFIAVADPWTATGEASVKFFLQVPEDGVADGTVLAYFYTTGTIHRFDLVCNANGSLALFYYNQNGTANGNTGFVAFAVNGKRLRLELNLFQDGADVDFGLFTLQATPGDTAVGTTGTITGRTFGIVNQVFLVPGNGVAQDASGVVLGHLTIHNTDQGQDVSAAEFWAWQRANGQPTLPEFDYSSTAAFSRLTRLCTENGIPFDAPTLDGSQPSESLPVREGLGAQLPRSLVALLRECEVAGQGQLWDGLGLGLSYTTRRQREKGGVALTLDAVAGDLAPPFAPVDDDQRTRNRVTASRTAGVSATHEDVTGPLGTATIGTYDSSLEVNGSDDTFVLQYAAWAVSLGTVEGYRVPTLTVDLRAAPLLAGAVLDLVPGARVQVTGPAAVLAGFPEPTLDLIVEGIGHDVSASGWRAVLRCSWASPWLIGRVASETGDTSEFVLRADTDGSTLAVAAPRTVTSLSVATTSGPLWTTAADDYPLTLDVGGIQVTATACSGSSSPQTFTVSPVTYDRAAGASVKLWDQRPLGL